ncbi:unnamed protein product [Closterium sp. NIES-65]|nr:unnamed protein product [Closterium sp. NIES-65]
MQIVNGSLPRVKRRSKPASPTERLWTLMVICGTMLFFVFLLILSGTSPKSEQTAPVLEVGTAPDSVRQHIADSDTQSSSSGGHKGKEDSTDSGGKLQIFSGAMAGMLSSDEPFTLFAPSDDFLLDISSVFHKYPRTKEMIDPMLSRLVGYSAVPRRIPAADIPLGAFERLESITGFIINVGRDPRTGRIFANGVPSKQVDILEGQLVVHLIDGMLGPLDFVESVRSMDPDDVSMEAALEQEFNSGAFVRGSESSGGGGGGGGGAGGGGEGGGEGGGGGSGKGGDKGTRQGESGQAAQGEQQQQQQQQQQQPGGDGQAEKVFLPEEQTDLGAAVAAAAAAAGLGLGGGDGAGGGGGGGGAEGEAGHSIEGQGEKQGGAGNAAAGEGGGEAVNTTGAEGGGRAGGGGGGGGENGGNGEGGGAAAGGFQWFGFGKGGAASKKEPEEDPVDNLPVLKPEVIAQEQVRWGCWALGTGKCVGSRAGLSGHQTHSEDPVDNLPVLKPEVIAQEQVREELTCVDFRGVREEEKAKPGVEVDFRGAHKGASVIEVPPPVDPTKLPCLGRGILQADSKCICAVLYGGDNCEETRNTDKLTVDPYVGSYLLTAQALMPPPPPAAGEEGSSGGGGGGSATRSAMLLEGLSIEERRQLRAVLPLTDIYQTTVWETCAVVGNSGALLLREDGEEIDKHDMVLRFNTAPTKGYEKQVGKKTTLRLSIPDKAGFREGNETVVYHLYLRGVKDELQHLLNFKRVFREGPLYLLDLGFESQVFNTFGAFTSVGYVGIQFALQKCHHIDLYGLFLSERHGVRHHYYNRDEQMPAQVTIDQLDREFVQSIEIADAELMWIADPCLYDCRRSVQRCSMCMRISVDELSQKTEWTSQQLALNSRREQRWREFLKWQLVVREELKKSVRLQFQLQAEQRRMRSSSGGLAGGSRMDGLGGDGTGKSGRGRGGLDTGGGAGRGRGAGGGIGERVGGGSGGGGGGLPGESEDEYDSIDWERVVVEDMLDKLSMHEVLLYFRRNHLTIPDTRAQMLQAVKAHYFFLRGELQKQKNRLYRPSD